MPDERGIATYFNRAVDVVTEQTRQIARLAYAVEQQLLMSLSSVNMGLADPCDACGCRLLTKQHTKCPACLTPTRKDV